MSKFWVYIPIYVDISTAEIISREKARSKEYTIINKTNHYQNHGSSKERTIVYECRHNGQTTINF